jgi:hypothetical protein
MLLYLYQRFGNAIFSLWGHTPADIVALGRYSQIIKATDLPTTE